MGGGLAPEAESQQFGAGAWVLFQPQLSQAKLGTFPQTLRLLPSQRKLGGSPGREGAGPRATSLAHRAICQGLCTDQLAPTPSPLIGCLRAHRARSAQSGGGRGQAAPNPLPPGKSQGLASQEGWGWGEDLEEDKDQTGSQGGRGAHLGRGREYPTSGKKRAPHIWGERGALNH